jgi:hypothetical protein
VLIDEGFPLIDKSTRFFDSYLFHHLGAADDGCD